MQPSTTLHAAMLTTTQHTKLTFTLTVPMNQPFNGPPVMPYDINNRMVTLPIPALPSNTTTTPNYPHHQTLTKQFCTTLAEWQKPLFGPIHRLQHNSALLLEISQAGKVISVISNALVQKSKQSGFAWVITNDTTTLWQGAGVAPGHEEDLYSGHAKAFGLIAGLTFLTFYITSYGHTQFDKSPLHCYCNNFGIITNVTKLLMPTIPCPN